MTDDDIESIMRAAGYLPGYPVTAPILRALVAGVEADCAARVQAIADRYRPIVDGTVDHQAQIARNAALSCVAAIRGPAC